MTDAKKDLKMELVKRFFKAPVGSFFLFGPRGTGKSTWLKENFRDAFFVDLLDPETARSYASYPETLINAVEALPEGSVVVVDEIQKLPEPLDVVHLLMERKKGIRFVLTGSSARKLKRTGWIC
jgi:predicted AAA+ superfamily ATPase